MICGLANQFIQNPKSLGNKKSVSPLNNIFPRRRRSEDEAQDAAQEDAVPDAVQALLLLHQQPLQLDDARDFGKNFDDG